MKKTLVLILTALLVLTSVLSVSCAKKIETPDPVSKEPQAPKEEAPLKLRVGSYNVSHARLVNFDVKTIADEIVSLDLDIVGIQEVDRFAKRSNYVDMLEKLVMSTGYPFCHFFKAIDLEGDKATYGKEGEYGLIILSKYPIKTPETIKLDCPGIEQRIIAHAVIDVKGTDVDFYNTHLSFESLSVRENQFKTLADTVKNKKPCIITGDFNIETASEFDAIPLSRVNAKDKTFITYPEDKLPLDNVFYTDEFKFISSDMNVTGHSDHNLIYAEFEFKPKTAEDNK
ncbi:MAG: endonuclease/exonuclease/phosphatase family protein [Clostridia bacterium]|nr:endonuclease/exonuclease/phosphatase family protein [Clostridia bacterium]